MFIISWVLAGLLLSAPSTLNEHRFNDLVERHHHRVAVQHQRRQRREREAEAQVSTPTPTPTPTPAPTYSSHPEVEAYLRAAGFPESVIPTMVGIAGRETGYTYCPTAVYGYRCEGEGHAVSGGPACGLWQLFPCPGPEALNPWVAAQIAYDKYQKAGLSPWS